MFKKLHRHLTIICTIITSLILLVVSFASLFISERSLLKNENAIFINGYNAVYSYLINQTNITTNWIVQMEESNSSFIYIEDNGTPLNYENINSDSLRKEIITLAKETALNSYAFDISSINKNSTLISHLEFTINDNSLGKYYVSCGYIPREAGFIGTLNIYSLANYQKEIYLLRLFFLLLNIFAIAALFVFSWFFTKKAIKPIEESRQRQTEFIAAASHELRSPLAVIKTSASALKYAEKQYFSKFLTTINSESLRMSRLINDMLILASADNKSWSINLEAIDLDTVLLNTYEAFQYLAQSKGIILNINLPPNPIGKCSCDKQRIEQVLSILIDNAISYSKETGNVTLTLEERNNFIDISIIDHGIGISDEDKKHIFDRFYRSDKSHHSQEHFGLGLCIAQEIILLHKGKLVVCDTPGGGTTFVVKLKKLK